MSNPLVSVVMSSFNIVNFLQLSVDSVLNQTYKNIELIIIEDCSTDGTRELAESLASKYPLIIKLINNDKNLGMLGLNKGLAVAKGKYIVRLDGDDYMHPERIVKQIKLLEEDPGVMVVGSDIDVCDMDMKLINTRSYPHSDEEVRKILFYFSPFCHSAITYRREEALKVNGYLLPLAQDYDFYFRMGKLGKLISLPEVLTKIRTRGEGLSLKKGRTQELYTLYIRLKACIEYGYSMKLGEKLYFIGQTISIAFIPPKVKFWLFNYLRKFLF